MIILKSGYWKGFTSWVVVDKRGSNTNTGAGTNPLYLNQDNDEGFKRKWFN